MDIAEVAKARYATKKFDADKRIPDEIFSKIKELLRFSPSSVNSQPWHFVIADSLAAKQRLAKGTQGQYGANEAKVLDASHVILFCAKTQIDDDYVRHLMSVEEQDGRFADDAAKDGAYKVRSFYVNMHRLELQDTECWMQKQVYLNMGTILLGAGALGVDAVPIEGVDTDILNEEFDLPSRGYSALAMVALGYRAEQDFNASLPKSRLSEDEIMTFI